MDRDPRVAAARQPWAEGCNAVGVGLLASVTPTCILALGVAIVLFGGPPTRAAETARADDDRVVAKVDGQAISARELERELAAALKDRPAEPAAREALRGPTLALLIKRRLALRYLEENKLGASAADVTQAVTRVGKQLGQQQLTLAEYLKRTGQTEAELRHSLAWQIGWPRFLERYLTDRNVERFFDQHRRDFDGTEMHVAHILFAVQPPGDKAAADKTAEQARAVLAEIRAGKVSFADAAAQHSTAPTGKAGGDIGLIGRRGPMPEEFSRAAFVLKKGQTSEPVATAFGVHLIHCLAIRPGEKKWTDVRADIERSVVEYLFQWTAAQQHPRSTVELPPDSPLREFRISDSAATTPASLPGR